MLVLITGLTACLDFGGGPRISDFRANPSTVSPGETVVLSWSVEGLEGGRLLLEAERNGSGGQVVSLGEVTQQTQIAVRTFETTTYRLVATGPTGTTSREVTVSVPGSGGGDGAPTIESFTASNSGPIESGETVRLEWSVDDADRVTIDPPGSTVSSSGSLDVQPLATTTYTLTASNESGTSYETVTVVVEAGERLLFLIAGQSNASGVGLENGGNFPTGETEQPVDGVYMLDEDREWVRAEEPTHSGYKHSFGLRFGKDVRAATGMEVFLVPAAVGGSRLDEWESDDSHYENAVSRAEFASNALGVPVAAVLWFQGESDTKTESMRQGFIDRTDDTFQRFHQELPGNPEIIFVQLSKRLFHGEVPGDNIEGHNLAYQVIREEQRRMAAGAKESEVGAASDSPEDRLYYHLVSSHDLPMSDVKHVSALGQRELGRRIANAFLHEVWSGEVSGTVGPAPRLEGVYLADGGRTVVVDTTTTVNQSSHYDGYFTVFQNGSVRTPSSIGRDPGDSTRVLIQFGSPLSGDVEVRYMPPDDTPLYEWTDEVVHTTVGGLILPLPAFGMPVEDLPEGTIPGLREAP